MEIFYSKAKLVKALLLALLMFAAAIFGAVKTFSDLQKTNQSVLSSFSVGDVFAYILLTVCAIGILFSFSAASVFLLRLFRAAPQVILSPGGIEDRRMNTGLIAWNEIAAVTLMQTDYAEWLNLILHSPEKYYARLPKFQLFLRAANGQKTTNSFRVRFTDLDRPIDEAWEYIENKIIKPKEEKGIHLMP